jgi:Ca2+-binding EF-hand superfamily protein
MPIVRISVYKNIGDEWIEQYIGTVAQIKEMQLVVEDDISGEINALSMDGKECYKSEDNVLILHNSEDDYALCFETAEIRDGLHGFITGSTEDGCFHEILRASRYMDDEVFDGALESREGTLEIIRMASFHLFKKLLTRAEKVFSLFDVAHSGRIEPQIFYLRIILKNAEDVGERYRKFVLLLNKQELLRKEAAVSRMGDMEVRSFLRRCYNSYIGIGEYETYKERINMENEYVGETFYYLCNVFRQEMAEKIDFKLLLEILRKTLVRKDDAMYIFEGLYTVIEECAEEKLNEMYMGMDGLFSDIEYYPELQRFLLHLTAMDDFRIREFLMNTGLLRRIFSIRHPSTETELFVAKMLSYVTGSSSKALQRHFISSDLLREGIKIYRGGKRDAVFSAIAAALEKAKGDIKEYLDRNRASNK